MVLNTPSNVCCDYLLELPNQGNSNKYLQDMFLRVNKKKKQTFHAILCWILYSTDLFLMANLGNK